MLPSPHVIFTAIEGSLLDPASRKWSAAEEALVELERRKVPLILVSGGTRGQIEPLRSKLGHTQPFITENGSGLFLPDGYFSMKLEGAVRMARYFCVPFAKDYAAATAALEEIAEESDASVVGFSQMSPREIAGNTGGSLREAELAHERDFSERFFFAGEADAAAGRFVEVAAKHGWQAKPGPTGQPFWELSSSNGPGRAIRHLMGLYRTALHRRLRSYGIGSTTEHLGLLAAVDHPIVLPVHGQEFDRTLMAGLKQVTQGAESGPMGWNQAVLDLFQVAGLGSQSGRI